MERRVDGRAMEDGNAERKERERTVGGWKRE